MDASTLKDWLIPVSTFVTLITASIGGWKAIKEYRLKVQAEIRLTKSAEAETDIKLIKLFTEIMNIAHARGGNQVSEKAIEKLLSPEILKLLDTSGSDTQGAIKKALDNAVINLPIGRAAQDAAICAIWALGKKHEVLKSIAKQALKSISEFRSEIASPYLKDLESN